jgi:hypothetical protein
MRDRLEHGVSNLKFLDVSHDQEKGEQTKWVGRPTWQTPRSYRKLFVIRAAFDAVLDRD